MIYIITKEYLLSFKNHSNEAYFGFIKNRHFDFKFLFSKIIFWKIELGTSDINHNIGSFDNCTVSIFDFFKGEQEEKFLIPFFFFFNTKVYF